MKLMIGRTIAIRLLALPLLSATVSGCQSRPEDAGAAHIIDVAQGLLEQQRHAGPHVGLDVTSQMCALIEKADLSKLPSGHYGWMAVTSNYGTGRYTSIGFEEATGLATTIVIVVTINVRTCTASLFSSGF